MSDIRSSVPTDFGLPHRVALGQAHTIAAPSHTSFLERFGHAFPHPQYLDSDLGTTALYDLPPPSGNASRHVLVIHGLNTPALGMLSLAKDLQALNPNAHVVLFDLWGHGLSSTPLVPHAPHVCHHQVFQVLGFMRWTSADIIGFSFGGSTAATFAIQNPWAVSSVAILGPAGLLDRNTFGRQMQDLLEDSTGKEAEARDCVLSWLEGGPLRVPADWQDRVKNGEMVAEALREWALQEHHGYPHSILSMFREGGVWGSEDLFRKFTQLDLEIIGIVGELDPVCSKRQLSQLGFKQVEVVDQADHSFVRSASGTVARLIHNFWTRIGA